MDYVRRKYGDDHVAQIVTFGTMAARAAIRDVGRALNMTYAEVDVVAKLVPTALHITLKDALKLSKQLSDLYETDERVRQMCIRDRAMEEHPGSILCRVVAENNGKVSGQSAFIAAREGDPVGQSVCDEYIGYLAAGVTNVVNIFQPDTLAIGGGVSNESDEQLLLPLRRLVEQESIPCNRDKRTRIVKAQLGNNAGIIGAALLGKRKLRK